MATAVQIVQSPAPATGILAHPDAPRRSPRLHVHAHSSPKPCANPSVDRCGQGRSRSPRRRVSASQHGSSMDPCADDSVTAAKMTESSPVPLKTPAEPVLTSRSPPSQVSRKRRRGSDPNDRATITSSPTPATSPKSVPLEDTTPEPSSPRALRALKRRRLSSSAHSPPVAIDEPRALIGAGPAQGTQTGLGNAERSGPNLNLNLSPSSDKVDRDLPLTAIPADAAGTLENPIPIWQEETRGHSDIGHHTVSAVVQDTHTAVPVPVPNRDAPALDATLSAARELETPAVLNDTPITVDTISDTNVNVLPDLTNRELLTPPPVVRPVNPIPVPAPPPAPVSIPFRWRIAPSPLSQPPITASDMDGVGDADVSDDAMLSDDMPAPGFKSLIIHRRPRRTETVDMNVWKLACQERVACLVRRYTREIVQAVVAAQAEHYFYRPTEFQHYTPDSYTDEAGPDAMDTEGSKTSGDEYDDDSDDDDMAVDTDEEAPQGCDVMHVDLTEQPAPPSPMASVEPAVAANQAIVATPYAFAMAYWLPPLSSIRVPWLEPCTFLTPEGKAYMGRGTPVDRQRRAGWAAAPAPAPAAPPPDYNGGDGWNALGAGGESGIWGWRGKYVVPWYWTAPENVLSIGLGLGGCMLGVDSSEVGRTGTLGMIGSGCLKGHSAPFGQFGHARQGVGAILDVTHALYVGPTVAMLCSGLATAVGATSAGLGKSSRKADVL
ncbi:hypothetical protein IEO21_02547 [Rhodonia placenta]|uniref:Uncharacterized protein n=1 Tax=Rhodonia placenta TaxID=104341 RepID=A0A8H7P7E8_9APHY|nr:hypothetical protein IEO21_02547 [Postia placenta]